MEKEDNLEKTTDEEELKAKIRVEVEEEYKTKDKPSLILNVISFFSSTWAMIIWLVLYNNMPRKAHSAGYAGVIGLIIRVAIVVILVEVYILFLSQSSIMNL